MADGEQLKKVLAEHAAKTLNPRKLLIEEGLYQEHDESAPHGGSLQAFKESLQFDSYCPRCRQNSTFHRFLTEQDQEEQRRAAAMAASIHSGSMGYGGKREKNHVTITMCCARARHIVRFHFEVEDSKFQKVGQYPSVADFALGALSRFNRVAEEDTLGELRSAIILNAHGYSVGAFAYARRAFEKVIEAARKRGAEEHKDFDDTAFRSAKMNERIVMLRDYLPEIMVQNAALYGILSLGIHELTEEDCRDHFELIRESVERILEDTLERWTRDAQEKRLTSEIGRLAGKLGKKDKQDPA